MQPDESRALARFVNRFPQFRWAVADARSWPEARSAVPDWAATQMDAELPERK